MPRDYRTQARAELATELAAQDAEDHPGEISPSVGGFDGVLYDGMGSTSMGMYSARTSLEAGTPSHRGAIVGSLHAHPLSPPLSPGAPHFETPYRLPPSPPAARWRTLHGCSSIGCSARWLQSGTWHERLGSHPLPCHVTGGGVCSTSHEPRVPTVVSE